MVKVTRGSVAGAAAGRSGATRIRSITKVVAILGTIVGVVSLISWAMLFNRDASVTLSGLRLKGMEKAALDVVVSTNSNSSAEEEVSSSKQELQYKAIMDNHVVENESVMDELSQKAKQGVGPGTSTASSTATTTAGSASPPATASADKQTEEKGSPTSPTQQQELDIADNAEKLKAWRKNIRDKCQAATTKEEVFAISNINKIGFTMPSTLASTTSATTTDSGSFLRRCKYVVMDFGANIGDTAGHVIDSGLIGCNRRGGDVPGNPVAADPTFDVVNKRIQDARRNRRNPLTRHLVEIMATTKTGPEDYCFYGIEGNPVFTQRLRELETFVMDMRPRPVQHLHFFTESVAAGTDGPTKLYLDTINAANNFWGSSIFEGHQDVRKSAEANNSTAATIAANVTGYTLGTMIRQTTTAFATPPEGQGDAAAKSAAAGGGHLLIKLDVEGGEFPFLKQAADNGTLCEYVRAGNRVDLIVEYHSPKVTGSRTYHHYKKEFEKTLKECGVKFRGLSAGWA